MIEDRLLDFGSIGIFCCYLIYDKQIAMKRITDVLEKMSIRIQGCPKVNG